MTTTTTERPCEASPDCLHPTCRSCGAPIRSSWQGLTGHPGTIKGFTTTRLCKKHHSRGKSNVLSESEMAWLRTAHPHAYAFHQKRRARGTPPHGTRLTGEKMTLKVQRLHPDATLPTRAHPTDAGLDLYAAQQVGIPVLGRNLVGTGIAVAIPAGHVGYITPRSGLAFSSGITVLNAPGTIDAEYTGEVKVNLVNHGHAPYVVTPGQRIAQLVIHKVELPEVEEVDQLPNSERGGDGFGSTGK